MFLLFYFLLLYRLWKDVMISLKEDDVEKVIVFKYKVLLFVFCCGRCGYLMVSVLYWV